MSLPRTDVGREDSDEEGDEELVAVENRAGLALIDEWHPASAQGTACISALRTNSSPRLARDEDDVRLVHRLGCDGDLAEFFPPEATGN